MASGLIKASQLNKIQILQGTGLVMWQNLVNTLLSWLVEVGNVELQLSGESKFMFQEAVDVARTC